MAKFFINNGKGKRIPLNEEQARAIQAEHYRGERTTMKMVLAGARKGPPPTVSLSAGA